MKYVSQLFQPLITIPKNAKLKNTEITCKSQKLLLECGLIRPTSSGFFALLPLARRALDKLEALVIQTIESVGGQRVSLPALTSAQLWEKSGRLDEVGSELMQVEDRHKKKYLLAPTHEEAIADLLADVGPLSYKQLPLLLYQIGNKYRDEHRPKHGLLRAREFSMLDAYGAHADHAQVSATYRRVGEAYKQLFDKLQLKVHRVDAACGTMGGSVSHEWQVEAAAGEDQIRLCECGAPPSASEVAECPNCGRETRLVNSIEVGHTFVLGSRYSEPLAARLVPASGPPQPVLMTCYGIGITRLLAACLEVFSTETSLRWPRAIAPYHTIVIGPKEGSKEWQQHGIQHIQSVSDVLAAAGDVLVDDRHHLTVGKRVMMADRMGYPNIVVCGRNILDKEPRYELLRPGAEPALLPLGAVAAAVGRGEGGEGRGVEICGSQRAVE